VVVVVVVVAVVVMLAVAVRLLLLLVVVVVVVEEAPVECYWPRQKDKAVPVPLYLPQISHGLELCSKGGSLRPLRYNDEHMQVYKFPLRLYRPINGTTAGRITATLLKTMTFYFFPFSD
jgi:hypothetical protein